MPTRAQVLDLLHEGHSFQTAARELKIPPGQAYLIATGLPADGSDSPHPEELRDKPVLSGSSQQLVGAPPFNPTGDDAVAPWVSERAARELSR